MARRKSRKRKRSTAQQSPRQARRAAKPTISRLLQRAWPTARIVAERAWKTLAGIAVLIGLAVYCYPQLSVSSSASLNPQNPYATPFVVTNEGLLPIYDVRFSCAPHQISTNTFSEVEFSDARPPVPKIAGRDKATAFCWEAMRFTPLEFIDLDIVVRFRAYWLPRQQEKHFRFATLENKDGKLQWSPKSLSE